MRLIKKTYGAIIAFECLLLVLQTVSVQAQSPHTNYLRTRIPQIPIRDTTSLDTIPIQRQAINILYSDALGRNLQSVQVQGSPTGKDVVVPFTYDYMGRATIMYMPYADQGTGTINPPGALRANAVTSAIGFYNPSAPGAPKIATDAAPYTQTVYERSPLGRIVEQGEAGSVFQPGGGHTVKASYNVNTNADGISYYAVHDDINVGTAAFVAGTLTKTIVTDQNGHRTALWKDLQGRPVTRTQLDAPTGYYSTDYVYNDLGQLSNIITPLAKKNLSTAAVSQLGFAFHYDSLGRVVEKKVPGKGWVFMVYNHSDLPVLSQDSNLRAKKQWMYMKYDAEGRIVQTGIYTDTTITGRRSMQAYCDNNFVTLWEARQPGTGYTNNAFPQVNAALYTAYYYDDYSFTEASSKPFQSNMYNTTPTQRTMGMLTGVSVYVLGTANQRLVTVNYYDVRNHLIQQVGDNHLGHVDIVNNQYNFIGELTGSNRITTPLANNIVNIKDRYVYDHLGRLMDTFESLNGAAEIDISHNVYNELSQKVTEGLHSTGSPIPNSVPNSKNYIADIARNNALTTFAADTASNSITLNQGFTSAGNSYIGIIKPGAAFAQVEEFRYNIKSELTSINNGTLTYDNGLTQSDPNALFGESITYHETSPLSATPQYNGNIAGITWRNKIEQTGQSGLTVGGQGYAFSYDNVNRLTGTGYFTQNGSSFTQNDANALTENITGYDEQGNILGLQRKDKNGNMLNSLTYSYPINSNTMTSISDVGTQNISGSFSYDGNGNMMADTRKNITLTYNYLDLVDTVKQGNNRLVFTYDAAGNKLYKQLSINGTVTSQRHYVQDVEVTASSSISYDGKIESVAMDEGRIINTGSNTWQYEYYLQDHLYTNRVSFRPNANGTVSLAQAQNYYPFGGDVEDGVMNYNISPQNLYKYEGKELQSELSINNYDFGARNYDPVICRWTSIDPLADGYESFSPYNYVENNPIDLIDPDGMQPSSKANSIPMDGGGLNKGKVFGSTFGPVDYAMLGVAALTSTIGALNAFSWGHTQSLNRSRSLVGMQQNTIKPQISASSPFASQSYNNYGVGAQLSMNIAISTWGKSIAVGFFGAPPFGQLYITTGQPTGLGGGLSMQGLLGVSNQKRWDISGAGEGYEIGYSRFSGSYSTTKNYRYHIIGFGPAISIKGFPKFGGGANKTTTYARPFMFPKLWNAVGFKF